MSSLQYHLDKLRKFRQHCVHKESVHRIIADGYNERLEQTQAVAQYTTPAALAGLLYTSWMRRHSVEKPQPAAFAAGRMFCAAALAVPACIMVVCWHQLSEQRLRALAYLDCYVSATEVRDELLLKNKSVLAMQEADRKLLLLKRVTDLMEMGFSTDTPPFPGVSSHRLPSKPTVDRTATHWQMLDREHERVVFDALNVDH